MEQRSRAAAWIKSENKTVKRHSISGVFRLFCCSQTDGSIKAAVPHTPGKIAVRFVTFKWHTYLELIQALSYGEPAGIHQRCHLTGGQDVKARARKSLVSLVQTSVSSDTTLPRESNQCCKCQRLPMVTTAPKYEFVLLISMPKTPPAVCKRLARLFGVWLDEI